MIYVLDPEGRAVNARSHCEVEGPCFLATITSIQTGKRDRAAMINCAYELQYYLHCAEGVVIEALQMLCPPTVNGGDAWSLEDLVQIVFLKALNRMKPLWFIEPRTVSISSEIWTFAEKSRRVWYSKLLLRSHIPRISNRVPGLSGQQLYAPLYVKPARESRENSNGV